MVQGTSCQSWSYPSHHAATALQVVDKSSSGTAASCATTAARHGLDEASPLQALKIICPNGHFGFAPLRTESFELGVAAGPG